MEGSQMRANYNIFMIDQLKIFKMIISLVTIIILYVLLLALIVGVANILLNIKSILFGIFGGL
jgi:uncharacterized membrane protein (DUF373 family)